MYTRVCICIQYTFSLSIYIYIHIERDENMCLLSSSRFWSRSANMSAKLVAALIGSRMASSAPIMLYKFIQYYTTLQYVV